MIGWFLFHPKDFTGYMADADSALQDASSIALPGLGRLLISAGQLSQKAAEDIYRKSRSSRSSRFTVFQTCWAALVLSAKKPPVEPSRLS